MSGLTASIGAILACKGSPVPTLRKGRISKLRVAVATLASNAARMEALADSTKGPARVTLRARASRLTVECARLGIRKTLPRGYDVEATVRAILCGK